MRKILPTALAGFTLMMYHGGESSSKYRDYGSCRAAIEFMKEKYTESSSNDWTASGSGFCIPDQEEIDKMRGVGKP